MGISFTALDALEIAKNVMTSELFLPMGECKVVQLMMTGLSLVDWYWYIYIYIPTFTCLFLVLLDGSCGGSWSSRRFLMVSLNLICIIWVDRKFLRLLVHSHSFTYYSIPTYINIIRLGEWSQALNSLRNARFEPLFRIWTYHFLCCHACNLH